MPVGRSFHNTPPLCAGGRDGPVPLLRYVSPEDEVPERVVRYVIGSLGFDSYNKYIQEIVLVGGDR